MSCPVNFIHSSRVGHTLVYRHNTMSITLQIVPCLSDEQLVELGNAAIGDRTTAAEVPETRRW